MNSSLEISNVCLSTDQGKGSVWGFRHWKKCEGCQKVSCVCGELTRSPTFKIRTRASPNNFKRRMKTEKNRVGGGLGSVITPSHAGACGVYIPYLYSKKRLSFENAQSQSNIFKSKSVEALRTKIKSRLSIGSFFKVNFEKDAQLKEKIISIGLKYVGDPDCRYQRKRLLELLYNLIRKGEKADYACSTKGKLEEIAIFLIKHNSELNFEKFLFRDKDNEHLLIQRFDEFLKTFSSSILL